MAFGINSIKAQVQESSRLEEPVPQEDTGVTRAREKERLATYDFDVPANLTASSDPKEWTPEEKQTLKALQAIALKKLRDPSDMEAIRAENAKTVAQQVSSIEEKRKKLKQTQDKRKKELYWAVMQNRRMQRKAREELRNQEDKEREEANARHDSTLFGGH
jgi:hypothetical protein